MRHLDSWIKIDQLYVTCFIVWLFNAQQVSDVNTSIVRSSRLICWVISWVVLLSFDVCWCYVVVHRDTTPPLDKPQRNTNTSKPEQYNPRNISINNSQVPEDGCINIRNMFSINHLTPNGPYSGRTAPLTSKRCILYIYSTNTGTEYSKHGVYSPFFSLQNAVCFIILTYLVPVLFIFYIQSVLKF